MVRGATVAVAIPTWNGWRFLEACLRSLERQTMREFRTIVVDNGSTDGTIEGLRREFPWVETIANPRNVGFAAAINQAFAAAFSDPACRYVITLNNDTVADVTFVEALVRAAERLPGAGSLQAKMRVSRGATAESGAAGGLRRLDAAGIYLMPDLGANQLGWRQPDADGRFIASEVLGACAGAALYRREALEDEGATDPFDPIYFAYYEDVDLALRLRLRGWAARYVPEAAVDHLGSATAGAGSPFQYHRMGRNRLLYMAKNIPAEMLIERAPLIVLQWLMCLARATIRGGPAHVAAYLRGTLAGIRALPRVLGERRRILSQARRPVATLERFIRSKPRRWPPAAWRADSLSPGVGV